MANDDDVRRVALSLPETSEKPYNHLPGFRVKSNLFARIHEQPEVMMIGCADLEEKEELMAAQPDTFFSTKHYDGYPAVLVRLPTIGVAELTELLVEAWRRSAPKRVLAAYDAEHPRD